MEREICAMPYIAIFDRSDICNNYALNLLLIRASVRQFVSPEVESSFPANYHATKIIGDITSISNSVVFSDWIQSQNKILTFIFCCLSTFGDILVEVSLDR